MTAPKLQRAAFQFADRTSARLAELDSGATFHATVTTVAAGAARDGNALVQVKYRGRAVTCAGYPAAYSPAVGDRVLCLITRDHQLAILHRSVGAP